MSMNVGEGLDRVLDAAKRLAGATDQRVQHAEERAWKRMVAERWGRRWRTAPCTI
jgi:hypothetical protein